MQLPINGALYFTFVALGATGTVTLEVGYQRPGSPVESQKKDLITINADGQSTATFLLPAPELLWYSLKCNTSNTDGIIMATVSLTSQSQNAFGTGINLSVGAVYTEPIHAWRDRPLNVGLDVQFPLFVASIAQPALGASATLQLQYAALQVESIRFTLTTDATVANRFGSFSYTNQSGNIYFALLSSQAVAASTAGTVQFANSGQSTLISAANQLNVMPVLRVPSGGVITVGAAGLVAGDQVGPVRLCMRMFPSTALP